MPDIEQGVLRQGAHRGSRNDEGTGSLEETVIYVFAIRNHRQIDKRLWSSISHHWTTAMERFGGSKWELMPPQSRVYIKRCTYRAPERTTGEVVVPPGEWPLDGQHDSDTAVVSHASPNYNHCWA